VHGFDSLGSSWPGKSAKRVFTLYVPAIHVLLVARDHKGVDARDKPGHDKVKQKGPGKTGAFEYRESRTDQRE
jgi:hypothetical protein